MFRVPVFVLVILLCIGAILHASLCKEMKKDPTYLELELPGGRRQSVYYECEGISVRST